VVVAALFLLLFLVLKTVCVCSAIQDQILPLTVLLVVIVKGCKAFWQFLVQVAGLLIVVADKIQTVATRAVWV
jgi:phosphoglycerol transferase MdoB-like AlkP superfamily enzyme